MSKKLFITEKPSVARDFARVLNVTGRNNGFFENNEYVISWCYGHLVSMLYPESYDIKYKSWKLEDLPFLPKDYMYGVIETAAEQYEVVNNLLHREDIDTVYWAGDSGKEGQTIEENIRNYGGVREGMTELRVWIDSQTDDEILRGIREAKPMSDYALLGKSGIMRAIEDYSVGINFSRALSVKYGRLLNDAAGTASYTAIAVGRVMTCVLGMVVDREREIRNFDETPFFRVMGNFSEAEFEGEWKAVEGSKYFNSPVLYKENGFKKREGAENLINELTGKKATVIDKEISNSKKRAPLLYNLAELQADCAKRFKISPADTLAVVQNLYEKKMTTYPRTDARVLTKAVAKEIYKNLYGLRNYGPTAQYADKIVTEKKYLGLEKTSYVDDSKVTDHYAIIPTGQVGAYESLSQLEKNVYDAIVRRFLSIFYPAAEYKNIKITVGIENENFYASAKVLTSKGYLEIAGVPGNKDSEGEDEDQNSKQAFIDYVNNANAGGVVMVNGFDIKEGKTSPPKRYTSGTLILAMENAGNLIEDEELREQIKNTGIGTSATRGEILEKLVRIHYLNQNNKTQIITPENLGEMIYEVVTLTTPSLLNPEMTASWEKGLEGIVNGSVDDKDYRRKLEDFIRRETQKMIDYDLSDNIAKNINPFTGRNSRGAASRKPLGLPCPLCGGELTTTSFGYGCSNYFNEEAKCGFNLGQVAGVDIDEEDFKDIITKGKSRVIDNFKSKSKTLFSASLALKEDADGKKHITFDFEDVKPQVIEGVKCPCCNADMVSTAYAFRCSNYNPNNKDACTFHIGRSIAGKTITEEILTQLIANGKTGTLMGFKGKSGNKFDAVIILKKDENGKVQAVFDFDNIEAEKMDGVKCPDCGAGINVFSNYLSCEKYDASNPEACHFRIFKTVASKTLTNSILKQLLTNGNTETLRGFKGKSGNKFDACLMLKKNEAGKTEVVFDFESAKPDILEDVKCPDCGADLINRENYVSCSAYNPSDENCCRFSISKTIASKTITKANIIQLLSEGKTDTLRGFKGKSGKRFDACLSLKKNESGKTEVVFDFESAEPETLEGCKCPDCGSNLIIREKAVSCSAFDSLNDESCKFVVFKNMSGKTLTKANIIQLLSEGKTETIRGFKSKSGKKFDACLVLKKNESGRTEVNFDFEDVQAERVADVKCPNCGGDIVKTQFGYGCSNYNKNDENSCRFNIGTIAGLKLKDAIVKELLTEETTSVIEGFKSKSGNKFSARLALDKDENGKSKGIKFVFDNVVKEIPDIRCPKCGNKILKDGSFYRCENNTKEESKCSFIIRKIAGVELPEEQLIKLINDKKTDSIDNFLSPKGVFFTAKVKLDNEFNTAFEFDNN